MQKPPETGAGAVLMGIIEHWRKLRKDYVLRAE
jgi:hypothetical protein